MAKLEQMRAIFSKVEDPRARNACHKLFDIIFIALAATLAGATTCFQIAEFAEAKKPLLQKRLGLQHGVPSHDTFSRIFRIIDRKAFEAAFRDFTTLLAPALGIEEVVALDGKSVRNATEEGGRFLPLHLVNVWACKAGIALGQCKAPNRNEIIGALQLIEALSIEDTIVTADALFCRPDIARAILDKKADYVLALKANRPKLLKRAKALLAHSQHASSAEQEPGRSHGRFEHRTATVVRAKDLAQQFDFPGVAAVACIKTRRGVDKLPKTQKSRYFVLSRFMSAKRLLAVVRSHWGIENNLHWQLDVTFAEDHARARMDNAPENLAVLRKIALNVLKSYPAKMPLNHKVLRCGWDDNFLQLVLDHAAQSQQPQ